MDAETRDILNKLDAMATGQFYFGAAVVKALEKFTGITSEERAMLIRFRDGTHRGTDHVELQQFAIDVRRLANNSALAAL
ncbi:hypothetical protein [Paraburkholderia sp. GAS32]|uniref:hypothetical protein n=1 Tax=Paraburkholderia sp. GAS32 TaxID=3035129 RepID=UPI003D22518F